VLLLRLERKALCEDIDYQLRLQRHMAILLLTRERFCATSIGGTSIATLFSRRARAFEKLIYSQGCLVLEASLENLKHELQKTRCSAVCDWLYLGQQVQPAVELLDFRSEEVCDYR